MKTFAKYALGAAMLSGAAFAAASPASAQVSFELQFGNPGYGRYYSPPPRVYCDPRNRYFRACDDYYYDPVYYRGRWYDEPMRYRWSGNVRYFWIDNGWRRDEWRGPRPNWNRPGIGRRW
jgi:hypothetical protein